ncbi:MAG TPA: hypothetical protein VGQ94_02980 [Terriglobales bacterium]|nr:hypothetical protein [Terriglobales bacterium]
MGGTLGFLDKLRHREEKPDSAEARADAATQELSTWLAALMQRLEPDKIQFQPGETLGQVFARTFDEEEKAVRAAERDPAVQQLKLEGLARLRQQFPVDSPSGASQESPEQTGGQAMTEATADRPKEATYEMVLGSQEDLKEVPMATLMQLVSGWGTAVGLVAEKLRLPDSLRKEYRRTTVTVAPGPNDQEELVLAFRGAKEMVETYRARLKALGIDQG